MLEDECVRSAVSVLDLPTFHFEKRGLLHSPQWACVCHIDWLPKSQVRDLMNGAFPILTAGQLLDAMCGEEHKTMQGTQGASASLKEMDTSSKLQRFSCTVRGKKNDSLLRCSLIAADASLWRLKYKLVLQELTDSTLTSSGGNRLLTTKSVNARASVSSAALKKWLAAPIPFVDMAMECLNTQPVVYSITPGARYTTVSATIKVRADNGDGPAVVLSATGYDIEAAKRKVAVKIISHLLDVQRSHPAIFQVPVKSLATSLRRSILHKRMRAR